jgi:hypothetical protein
MCQRHVVSSFKSFVQLAFFGMLAFPVALSCGFQFLKRNTSVPLFHFIG